MALERDWNGQGKEGDEMVVYIELPSIPPSEAKKVCSTRKKCEGYACKVVTGVVELRLNLFGK